MSLVCLFSTLALGQTILWQEDFTEQTGQGVSPGPVTNMPGDFTKWSILLHDTFPTNGHFMVETNASSHEEYFEGNNLKGECVWLSETIDISSAGHVDLSLNIQQSSGMEVSDSVAIYYRLDGTNEILFAENGLLSGDFPNDQNTVTASQSYLSGTGIVIVVKMNNSAQDETYRIDDVTVAETSITSNSPPEISVENDETNQFAMVGEPIQFALTATENPLDAPTDTITLWAENLPTNATFATTNGLSPLSQTFYWTPGAPGSETVTFYAGDQDGTNALDVTITTSQLDPGKIWINEIHYDNDGNDTDEGIEIAGPVDYNLSNYKVYSYNGSDGGVDDELQLTGSIDNEGEGFGALWFNLAGIQNGAPDGMALVRETGGETNVLQFLTYEGSFVATDGPATGLTGVDIGIMQDIDTPIGETLQLTGKGKVYADFTWTGPVTHSRGSLNVGQRIVKPGFVLIVR